MALLKYSNAQRLSFAGVVIGFLLCLTGSIAPYWRKGSISANNILGLFDFTIPLLGDMKLSKFYGGLFWACIEVPLADGKDCGVYDFGKLEAVQKMLLFLVSVQTILSFICMITALCRSCCCSGGRTVCHGIFAFLAGGAGVAVVTVFAAAAGDTWELSLMRPEYDWAFYVYAVGSGITILASFVLCFASPDNQLTSMIMRTTQNPYERMNDGSVVVSQTNNSHMMSPVAYAGTGY
ncbi:uncharacterized protein LOC101853328 [Aplysia californica]|uniref:Uncharacterized protein LOC101853328 n=1 Tax=Aplysia californica TaxID=6500 RepID=A0ABM1A2Q9_APLCA|nr:uncharacterized protein LOC101853328 [Aplysia californica]